MQASARELDPITCEVIRSNLHAICRQMRNALIRASFNPVIYEMIDFSLGLYDSKAELIAEGPGSPLFNGTLTFTIRHVVAHLGEQNIHEGDVLLSTYAYWTGSHPQDAVIIAPVFVAGKIFGYAASKAHWIDIGAKDVYGIDTTDIWQEGLQLFAVKIVKHGSLDPELVDIIRANSRLPDSVVGDMVAQISACSLGARRVTELVGKYGESTVSAAVARLLDHGEQIARQALAAVGHGVWEGEAALDNNGIETEPVRVRVRVTIRGGEMLVDTTGSAAQQLGPVNSPLISTISAARLVMKMIMAPHYDANEGFFRPLRVVAPEGSVLNPTAPAPVFLYAWSALAMGDAIFQALAAAVPERAVARSGGDLGVMIFSGFSPEDGSFYASGADESCGQGAGIDQDGESATILWALGESRNVPVEILEQRFPILVERYELLQDSGGPGRFRGGLGVKKHWRALSDIKLITVLERTKFPAWGVDGGLEGVANDLTLSAQSPRALRTGKVSGYVLRKDEVLHLHMGGGGGWGDPTDREPQAVLRDITAGYVSIDAAARAYGVVVSETDGEYSLDLVATQRLRSARRLGSTA